MDQQHHQARSSSQPVQKYNPLSVIVHSDVLLHKDSKTFLIKSEVPQHRHQSHLIGVYPGHQIKADGEFADTALKTLEIKGYESTGWSCGWRVNLYARLGEGEKVKRLRVRS